MGKKGTIIFTETPQMRISSGLKYLKTRAQSSTVREVYQAFNKMSENDQKEYLNLYDYSTDLSSLPLELREKIEHGCRHAFEMSKKDEKIFKVFKIFATNVSKNGTLGLKMSRFNHACQPNAITLTISQDDVEYIALYCISKIKAGEEITITYIGSPCLEMGKKKIRREILLNTKCFVCTCKLCQEEEEDDNDDTIKELLKEVENLNKQRFAEAKLKRGYAMFPPSKSKREIECFRELYRHGMAKKAHPVCLFFILRKGYESASRGYICHQTEEFNIEVKDFAKTADKFDKLVPSFVKDLLGRANTDFSELWNQNFEEWVQLYISTHTA